MNRGTILSELNQYDYAFPARLVAQAPAVPRDAARLLVYDRAAGTVRHDTFKNLPRYLPAGTVLVLNQTKVIPARLELRKSTGGMVRVLYLGERRGEVRVLADRALATGSRLFHKDKPIFEIVRREEKEYILSPLISARALKALFEKFGAAPIPPYIKRTPLDARALKAQYQTVFAKHRGSAAAPTASLHFTRRLLRALERHGVEVRFVTLHVGLGTFAPLTPQQLAKNKLHEEWYAVPAATAKAVRKARREGRRVIAVGTTALRALESAFGRRKGSSTRGGTTQLFIRPGYRFRAVDGLITNFHVPRSSLMMLVAALTGREKLLSLYAKAIRRGYRLFSFGDGMLIL